MKRIVLALCCLALVSACADGKPAEKSYFARVNNATITKDDIDRELNEIPVQYRQMVLAQGIEKFVEDMVKKEILYQEARKKGISEKPALRKKLEQAKKNLMIQFLLEEEIESKSKVDEKEVMDYYESHKEDFEKFTTMLSEKDQSDEKKLDLIRGMIEERLLQEKQRGMFKEYMDGLRKSYTVEINAESIGKAFSNQSTP